MSAKGHVVEEQAKDMLDEFIIRDIFHFSLTFESQVPMKLISLMEFSFTPCLIYTNKVNCMGNKLPKYFKQIEINLNLVTIPGENICVPMINLINIVMTLSFTQYILMLKIDQFF